MLPALLFAQSRSLSAIVSSRASSTASARSSILPFSSCSSSSSSSQTAPCRSVPLHLFLECQSARPSLRHSSQQTAGSEWCEEKPQPVFVPAALPAVQHGEAASQTESAELWHWDGGELEQLLRALVDKSVQQALLEVAQEEKKAHTERAAADYDGRLAADESRVLQMERAERERHVRQQADVQAARLDKHKQHQLRTLQFAAANDSQTIAAHLRTSVRAKVEAKQRQHERIFVERLLQDNMLSATAPLYTEHFRARAAIDRCLHR